MKNKLIFFAAVAAAGLLLLCGCGGQSSQVSEITTPPAITQPAVVVAPPLSQFSESAPQVLKDYYTQNSDVKALLEIPGLEISLPVVQAKNNDYYLRRGLDKKYAYLGTLFLDASCTVDDTFGNNTIIYGHNVGKSKYDDRMFGRLVKYRNRDTFNAARIIKYTALNGYTYYYQVFSVYAFPGRSGTDRYYPIFTSFAENTNYNIRDMRRYEVWNTFVTTQRERSSFFASVPVSFDDKLLTLVTCVYDKDDYRLTVTAKLLSLEELEEYRRANPEDVSFGNYENEKIGNTPDYYLQHLAGSKYSLYASAAAVSVISGVTTPSAVSQ